jgi:hypothetical protein
MIIYPSHISSPKLPDTESLSWAGGTPASSCGRLGLKLRPKDQLIGFRDFTRSIGANSEILISVLATFDRQSLCCDLQNRKQDRSLYTQVFFVYQDQAF